MLGKADRKFNDTPNISVDKPQRAVGGYHNSHNRIDTWIDETKNE